MAWWRSKKGGDASEQEHSGGDSSADRLCLLEALLMVNNEPLATRKLALALGFSDPTAVRSAVAELNQRYDRSGRSYRVEEVAGGLQLLTRKQFAFWLRRAEFVPGEQLLSSGMLETLAIIAYRQPVVRAEVEAIRGVSCEEVLRQLLQRNLVRIAGRDEELGRPFLYGTTREFLRIFGLQSLDNLPRFQKIIDAEAEIAERIQRTRSGGSSPGLA
ncbi:MAG: hypothetical protein RL240_3270 [Planctomycetota bacterium]